MTVIATKDFLIITKFRTQVLGRKISFKFVNGQNLLNLKIEAILNIQRTDGSNQIAEID